MEIYCAINISIYEKFNPLRLTICIFVFTSENWAPTLFFEKLKNDFKILILF